MSISGRDCLAKGFHHLDILDEAFVSGHRTVAEEPFLRGEAALFCHRRSLSDESHVGYVVSKHGGVCGHCFAAGTADKHVDGLA